MKIDKTQESLHISEIIAGLQEIEQTVFNTKQGPGSEAGLIKLKTACLAYEKLHQDPIPIFYDSPLVKECCLQVAASMDLVRYFRKINQKQKIKVLKKHLKLVGTAGFGIAATYHNQQSKPSVLQKRVEEYGLDPLPAEIVKDATRKTIELMLGMASLNTFDEVTLEDPDHSDPRYPNPDVIIRHDNERFGIACKSLTSKNKTNLKDRIEEGVNQIEAAILSDKIDRYRGIVLLDVSAVLNHDNLYIPQAGHFWDASHVSQVLREQLAMTIGEILEVNQETPFKDLVGDLFAKFHASPCVIFYAHTLMIAASDTSVAPRYMKDMQLLFAGDHSRVKSFCEQLNNALHCQ